MESPVVGIDLGTRYSLASVYRDGEAVLIPNRWGGLRTPSLICLDKDGWHVGEEAKRRAFKAVFGCWRDVKRRLGTDWAPLADGRRRSAQEMLIPLLSHIREDCEVFLGCMVTDCVITVPAQFGFLERSAMARTAREAGFEDIRILNEPTAAALACECAGRTMVFDFGGGTIDVSVVERDGQTWQVLESLGDSAVGGAEIDRVLAREIASRLGLALAEDAPLYRLLLMEAEEIKCALSFQERLFWRVPAPFSSSGISELTVTRAEIEKIVSPWLEKAVALGAELWRRHDPQSVIMVGGSSRIPSLKKMLSARLPVPVRLGRCPDEAVALGAALYSVNGSGRLLLDVLSEDLGIMAFDGTMVPLLKKGHPLPARAVRGFKSTGDGDLSLTLFQGDPDRWKKFDMIARLELRGVKKDERVDLDFRIDQGGLLKVLLTRESGESIAIAPMELGVSGGERRKEATLRDLERRTDKIASKLDFLQRERVDRLMKKLAMLGDLEPHLYDDGLKVLSRMVDVMENEAVR